MKYYYRIVKKSLLGELSHDKSRKKKKIPGGFKKKQHKHMIWRRTQISWTAEEKPAENTRRGLSDSINNVFCQARFKYWNSLLYNGVKCLESGMVVARRPTGNTLFTGGEIVVCVQTVRMVQTVQNQPSCPLCQSGESGLKLASRTPMKSKLTR